MEIATKAKRVPIAVVRRPNWETAEPGTTLAYRDELRRVRRANGYTKSDKTRQKALRIEAKSVFEDGDDDELFELLLREPGHA